MTNNMEWHDIETAPKDGDAILAIDVDGLITIVLWHTVLKDWVDDSLHAFVECPLGRIQENFIFDLGDVDKADIELVSRDLTHWMPLPKPPADREEQ